MAVSVGSVGQSDYSAIISANQNNDTLKKLDGLNIESASDLEMLEACKEFEIYMIEQVYKSMEKTIIRADEEKNDYEEMFGDLRIQQYARKVSDQGGIGLAKQLYESMKNNPINMYLNDVFTVSVNLGDY